MSTQLPGTPSRTDLGRGVTKAALRLVGAGALGDIIGDLTGLGRTSVQNLAQAALATLADVAEVEYRTLGDAEKRWAEAVLVRTYQSLAHRPDRAMVRESIVGPERLASLAFGVGMSAPDRRDLDTASEDARTYYQLVSHAMARLVSDFYRTDPVASQMAVALTVGSVLEAVRDVLARLDRSQVYSESPTDDSLEVTATRLHKYAITNLSRVPAYYPPVFDTSWLAAQLDVIELGDENFYGFKSQGLYWDGHLHGPRRTLSVGEINPGEITVVLGNPGSGKSTLAKGLVLNGLAERDSAVYCRLEDFSRACTATPDAPDVAAVIAYARAVGFQVNLEAARRLVRTWATSSQPPLIVLDGLDELATASDYSAAQAGAARLAALGHPVLITSRVAGYTSPWPEASRHLAVPPLEPETHTKFKEAWMRSTGDQVAKTRFEEAVATGQLGSALSSPLILGFICMVAHHGHVPATEGAIFNRFTDHFLRGPWRAPSVQRVDPAQIAHLKAQAEEAAWAMARFNRRGQAVWLDSTNLDVLYDVIGDLDAYAAYASGLLIAHGPIEPMGGTQQSIRWLHRALHENFVARRLQRMIEADDPQWAGLVMQASFRATWNGALRQTWMLLSEGSALEAVVNYLCSWVQRSDTPRGHFAELLFMAAKHSSSQATRNQAALTLMQSGRWNWALPLAPDLVVGELWRRIENGERGFLDLSWSDIYVSLAQESDDLLDLAWRRECSDPNSDLAIIFYWRNLQRGARESREAALDQLCNSSALGWLGFLRPLEEPARSEILNSLEKRLTHTHPFDKDRLSLDRAYALWCVVTGDQHNLSGALPHGLRLRSAVLLGRWRDNNYGPIRDISGLIDGHSLRRLVTDPIVDDDVDPWGLLLHKEGYAFPLQDRDCLTFHLKQVHEFPFDSMQDIEDFHPTDESQDFALAIVNMYASTQVPFTWNRAETLSWALTLLARQPALTAIVPLSRLRAGVGGEIAAVQDSNRVQWTLNRQPWNLLAESVLTKPTGDEAWDAVVLTAAVNLATSEYENFFDLSPLKIVQYLTEGLRRWVSAGGSGVYEFYTLEFPEVVPHDKLKQIVEHVTALAAAHGPQVALELLRKVENGLANAGRLEQFHEQLSRTSSKGPPTSA